MERYLDQPTGTPTDDLMRRTREGLRIRLRALLQRAAEDGGSRETGVVKLQRDGQSIRVEMTVNPISTAGAAQGMLLVSFSDEPRTAILAIEADGEATESTDLLVRQLESELRATRDDLLGTVEELESSNEELKAANEEVMSVNEEFQSTNEELETSKEELQSLNEELTTLNNQLEEKLGELQEINDDLENLLRSTDIATIFLNQQFAIKRFTPSAQRLFALIAGDIGRPISDIARRFTDTALLTDAKAVLDKLAPIEKEVTSEGGLRYSRRILPYRTQENRIDGVVVTFVDITKRQQAEERVKTARDASIKANIEKIHFLSAASHDLRQPIQALALFNAVLQQTSSDPKILDIVNHQQEAVASIQGMLDGLLDLSKIEAGAIDVHTVDAPVAKLLQRTHQEFELDAQQKGLNLHIVPCSLNIRSDLALLSRIINNFVGNAIKLTERGKVLIGCRRRGDHVRIEVWDTGVGIPAEQLDMAF